MFKKLVSVLPFVIFQLFTTAQVPDSLFSGLLNDNQEVVNADCKTGKGKIVTNRALNVFFADKIGSYLTENGDLSLFNNYATLNSSDGQFSISHNFKHTGSDERVKSLTTVGAEVNISDAFATVFDGKKFSNELGITFKQTWLSRGSVYFDKCVTTQEKNNLTINQKDKMN